MIRSRPVRLGKLVQHHTLPSTTERQREKIKNSTTQIKTVNYVIKFDKIFLLIGQNRTNLLTEVYHPPEDS